MIKINTYSFPKPTTILHHKEYTRLKLNHPKNFHAKPVQPGATTCAPLSNLTNHELSRHLLLPQIDTEIQPVFTALPPLVLHAITGATKPWPHRTQSLAIEKHRASHVKHYRSSLHTRRRLFHLVVAPPLLLASHRDNYGNKLHITSVQIHELHQATTSFCISNMTHNLCTSMNLTTYSPRITRH